MSDKSSLSISEYPISTPFKTRLTKYIGRLKFDVDRYIVIISPGVANINAGNPANAILSFFDPISTCSKIFLV